MACGHLDLGLLASKTMTLVSVKPLDLWYFITATLELTNHTHQPELTTLTQYWTHTNGYSEIQQEFPDVVVYSNCRSGDKLVHAQAIYIQRLWVNLLLPSWNEVWLLVEACETARGARWGCSLGSHTGGGGRGGAVPLLYQLPGCLQHQPGARRSQCAPWVPLVLALMADRSADGLPCMAGLGFRLWLPTQKMIQNTPDPDPHNYDSTFGGSTVLILKNKTKQKTVHIALFIWWLTY